MHSGNSSSPDQFFSLIKDLALLKAKTIFLNIQDDRQILNDFIVILKKPELSHEDFSMLQNFFFNTEEVENLVNDFLGEVVNFINILYEVNLDREDFRIDRKYFPLPSKVIADLALKEAEIEEEKAAERESLRLAEDPTDRNYENMLKKAQLLLQTESTSLRPLAPPVRSNSSIFLEKKHTPKLSEENTHRDYDIRRTLALFQSEPRPLVRSNTLPVLGKNKDDKLQDIEHRKNMRLFNRIKYAGLLDSAELDSPELRKDRS